MKKVIVLWILLAISVMVSAQEIKTYKGGMSKELVYVVNFGFEENMFSSDGIWNYQYYENEDYERIIHGKVTYTRQYRDYNSRIVYTITGQYVHGKKEGQWVFKAVKNEKTTIAKCTFYYNDDLLDGTFDYYNEIVKLSGNFTKGNPVGKATCVWTLLWTGRYEAHFDINGYPDSVWTKNYEYNSVPMTVLLKFTNNFLVKMISIDQSTGERTIEEKDDFEVEEFFIPKNIADEISATNGSVTINNRNYYIEDGYPSSLMHDELEFNGLFEAFKNIGYSIKFLTIVSKKSEEERTIEEEDMEDWQLTREDD